MRLFSPDIAGRLSKECNGENIVFVGLGAHNFQLAFGNGISIQVEQDAVFCIAGKLYSWTEALSQIPFGLLLEQTPTRFKLRSALELRLYLKSGDFVDFHTSEIAYESVVVDFGVREGARIVEVF